MENTNPDTSRCTRQGRLALIIILSVLIIDQIIKIVVKTNMHLGQMIDVTSWFKICFVENNGMAFGMEIIGKLFLSLFRIGAIGFFIWYLVKILNKGFPTGYIVTVSFVIAGAIGNLIDCMFYGLIFSESLAKADCVAWFTAFGDGYAPFLYGKVVDMFYFPLWTWPDWMPLVGGDTFFNPVFNFADSCITCGVIALLLFYTKVINMGMHYSKEPVQENENQAE
ncbi:MAG: lipoprotein signal peptidase [Bacteroidaceae bacterium]|nr:lipoprotein signal peptidase [Bacteroidaceae bacterium]